MSSFGEVQPDANELTSLLPKLGGSYSVRRRADDTIVWMLQDKGGQSHRHASIDNRRCRRVQQPATAAKRKETTTTLHCSSAYDRAIKPQDPDPQGHAPPSTWKSGDMYQCMTRTVVWRPLKIPVRVHHSDGHTNGYLVSVSVTSRQLHTKPLSHIP